MFVVDELEVFGSENVDALTITSKSIVGRAAVLAVYENFLGEAQSRELQKEWNSIGYSGWICGSVRWGSRKDSSILMATGDDALLCTELAVLDLKLIEEKVTRVDVCLDIAFENNARGWLTKLRNDSQFCNLHHKQGREISLIDSTSGETLYIGKRTSGRFGRIYDKSAHYGLDQGFVYRFEIESKKDVARPVFDALFPLNKDSEMEWNGFQSRLRGVLKSQFRRWGVSLKQNNDDNIMIRSEARISTVDSQLEWLSRSVAPVLERLTQQGYRQAAFLSLFGEGERIL